MRFLFSALAVLLSGAALGAQVPENLVADGVPPELRADPGRYLEFRAATLQGWHPQRRKMLVSTRFADTAQLHLVKAPGAPLRQLTFGAEPVAGGSFRPKTGGVWSSRRTRRFSSTKDLSLNFADAHYSARRGAYQRSCGSGSASGILARTAAKAASSARAARVAR